MDRTIIDTYRAEERELSKQIHKKLKMLMAIYQTTADFRKIFVEGMFMKPNQKGFFHVMHFLFIIFDATEFRKRFYWPITDKKSEGIFRTSVVEYLNYINKKHNLQWKQQWNYLVQMPGGNKFLTFIIEFTDFVTNEAVKQKEKCLEDKNWKFPEIFNKSLLMKLKLRNQCFKVNTLRYVEILELQTKKYKENSEKLKAPLHIISKTSNISLYKLVDETFISNFCAAPNKFLNEEICIEINNISKTENNLKTVHNIVESFELQKLNLKYDSDKFATIIKQFSLNEDCKNEINFQIISKIFTRVCPIMDDSLSVYDAHSFDILSFEKDKLSQLRSDVLKLDTDMKSFNSNFNRSLENLKRNAGRARFNVIDVATNSNLVSKLVFTPPIINFSDTEGQFRSRLPLMRNILSPRQDEFTFVNNDITVMLPVLSARKQKDNSKLLNKSQSTNTKKHDPSTFLRSLKKSGKALSSFRNKVESQSLIQLTKKRENLESLFYEKERQYNLKQKKEDENFIENILKDSNIIHDSFKVSESLVIHGNAKKVELSKRKLFPDIPQQLTKIVKSSSNFLKQDNPLDLEKISTSPSGRLDPLVKFNNDVLKTLSNQADVSISTELDHSNKVITGKFVENCSTVVTISDMKESIFNVSDSILKDVI